MTPGQARLSVTIYTGVVIASVALALAGLTWRLLGNPGVGPAAPPVVARSVDGGDIRPVIALAPFGMAILAPAGGAGSTAVHLKGILMAVPAQASVALLEREDGTVGSYGIGSAVGGGVIESIQAEQVAIRTPSGIQLLGFAPVDGPAAVPKGPSPGASIALPVSHGPAISSASADLTASAGASIAPPPIAQGPATFSPGAESTGYRVGNAPGPQLVAVGVRPGDVIKRVNGTPVGSGANEREFMAGAIATGQAQIELIRDGRQVSLTAQIR